MECAAARKGTVVTSSTEAPSTDGQRRIPLAEIAGRHLVVTAQAARVELGHSAGDQVRVRWTVPNGRLRATREPVLHLGAEGLRIECWKARLRIDLPSGMKVEVRVARGQITSWGADADLDLATRDGSIACRELRGQVAVVRASDVNLHFAAEPQSVEVDADRVVVALPGGPYAVTAPPAAEITVPLVEGPSTNARRVSVRADVVRILAAGTPLILTGDGAGG